MKNAFVQFTNVEQISNYSQVFSSQVPNGEVRALDFDNSTGNHLLVLGEDRNVNILNMEYNKIEATHKLKHEITGGYFCPSLSNSDNILTAVISDTEGNLTILDYNIATHSFA